MDFYKYKAVKQLTLSVLLLLSVSVSYSADKNLSNLKVEMLSAFDHVSQVLVRIDPRTDLSGMSCTYDHWLTVSKNTENYEEIFAMLLAASVSQQNLFIGIQDVPGQDYCSIRRVAIMGG